MPGLVAVTGATGFIGRALTGALLETGRHVRALGRRVPPDQGSIEWMAGTLEDKAVLSRLVNGADAVIHCAGQVRGHSARQFVRTNVEGTANIVRASAAQNPLPRFLFVSSLAAREPGLSCYANSKYLAEKVVADKAGAMPWTVFRPTAVYGPGDRELRPVFNACRRGILPVPGSPARRFSLIHIDDLVAAILLWVASGEPVQGVYELDDGTPGGYDYRQLAAIAGEVWGRRVFLLPLPLPLIHIVAGVNLLAARTFNYLPMLTPGKLREIRHPDWSCDNTPLKQALGWRPAVSLRDALAGATSGPERVNAGKLTDDR